MFNGHGVHQRAGRLAEQHGQMADGLIETGFQRRHLGLGVGQHGRGLLDIEVAAEPVLKAVGGQVQNFLLYLDVLTRDGEALLISARPE